MEIPSLQQKEEDNILGNGILCMNADLLVSFKMAISCRHKSEAERRDRFFYFIFYFFVFSFGTLEHGHGTKKNYAISKGAGSGAGKGDKIGTRNLGFPLNDLISHTDATSGVRKGIQ